MQNHLGMVLTLEEKTCHMERIKSVATHFATFRIRDATGEINYLFVSACEEPAIQKRKVAMNRRFIQSSTKTREESTVSKLMIYAAVCLNFFWIACSNQPTRSVA